MSPTSEPTSPTADTAGTEPGAHPSAPVADPAVAEYALGLGDDALILAQRLSGWISRAPELEEDMALANIALDLLGHARALLSYAGSAWGKSEDDLAYLREESAFRCHQIFEQPRGDFADTIVRQQLISVYFAELYRALSDSTDPTLAAIAQKAAKEVAYHLEHAETWLARLAHGTELSRQRTRSALERIWPFTEELFTTPALGEIPGVTVDPASLRAAWTVRIEATLAAVELAVPEVPTLSGGGRRGIHSECFGPLLAEMQVLARRHPGATW